MTGTWLPHRTQHLPPALTPVARPRCGAFPLGGVLQAITPARPPTFTARIDGELCSIPLGVFGLWRPDLARAGELICSAGGFDTALRKKAIAAARIWMMGCADAARARRRIVAVTPELLQHGMQAVPDQCLPIGCIPALDVREYGAGNLEVVLYAEDADAPSRRALRAAARAMAHPLTRLAECSGSAAVQLGVVETARVRARCELGIAALDARAADREASTLDELLGDVLLHDVITRFAADEHQPELAAKHNAAVIDAMSSTAVALQLEPFRIEAAARSHAARWGSCEPLVRWRKYVARLQGDIEMPIDLTSIAQRLEALGESSGHDRARQHAVQIACAGLTASLVFVRATVASAMRARAATEAPSAKQPDHALGPQRRACADPRLESGVHAKLDYAECEARPRVSAV